MFCFVLMVVMWSEKWEFGVKVWTRRKASKGLEGLGFPWVASPDSHSPKSLSPLHTSHTDFYTFTSPSPLCRACFWGLESCGESVGYRSKAETLCFRPMIIRLVRSFVTLETAICHSRSDTRSPPLLYSLLSPFVIAISVLISSRERSFFLSAKIRK